MKGKAEKKAQQELEKIVGYKYPIIRTNIRYKYGEMDFMGRREDGKWDVYEIKSTQRNNLISKAKKQLKQIEIYFKERESNYGASFLYISNLKQIIPM